MKCCVLLAFLVVVVVRCEAQYGEPSPIIIVSDDRTQNGYGEYKFAYAGSDGTVRKEAGAQNDGQLSEGGWSYTSPEGYPVAIQFEANHGGYQPVGDVIPVAPPLPYQRTGV